MDEQNQKCILKGRKGSQSPANPPKLRRLISNPSEILPTEDGGNVIYKVKHEDCDKYYIG